MTSQENAAGTTLGSALLIGLDPELIDFTSPDFAAFPGITAAKVMEGLTAAEVGLKALGYDALHCLTDFGESHFFWDLFRHVTLVNCRLVYPARCCNPLA